MEMRSCVMALALACCAATAGAHVRPSGGRSLAARAVRLAPRAVPSQPRAAGARMMFDRLEKDAVRALMEAQKEAKRLGAAEVDARHVLLGLVSQKDGTAGALSSFGVSAPKVREAIARASSADGGAGGADLGRVARLFQLQTNDTPLPFAAETEVLLQAALSAANPAADREIGTAAGARGGGGTVSTANVLEGLAAADDSSAVRLLTADLGVDLTALRRALADGLLPPPEAVAAGGNRPSKNSTLAQCGVDMTQLARSGQLDPVHGRDEEIDRMMQTLVRRRKNNPCLVGDPGVGKTALAEGLALRMAAGEVPPALRGKRLFSLELGLLVADTKYRGEFEERLRTVLDELDNSTILFIDEIHTLVGAGSAEGGIDAANLLKPALARGRLQCIGATTLAEYRKHIEKDAALERRFQPLLVGEPTPQATVAILRALAPAYAAHHGVANYSEEALAACASLSARYITDRFLPDKAIDLLDEAGAAVQLRSAATVAAAAAAARTADAAAGTAGGARTATTAAEALAATVVVSDDDVTRVVSRWTGIPVDRLSSAEAAQLLSLEASIGRRVIGQHAAVSALARAIRRARVGLRPPTRPVASFVFCGPTGVGKTELAKAVAEVYYGNEGHMVRLDMSEYMEAHTVARLVGPPPGYVGYDAGGQLTEAVRRRPHCVVLLDEIEKAHPDVFNALLQVLEDGRLTDGKGRTVDFTNTLLILTSNVGSVDILSALGETDGAGAGAAGAVAGGPAGESSDGSEEEEAEGAEWAADDGSTITVRVASASGAGGSAAVADAIGLADDGGDAARGAAVEQLVKEAMMTRFRPEFLNRLDQLIVFLPLARAEVRQIAGLLLAGVRARTAERGVELRLTDAMEARLVDAGFDMQYGARPLRRAVQRLVEDVVAECLLDGFALSGESLTLDVRAALGDGGGAGGGGDVCARNGRGQERWVATADVQGIERAQPRASRAPGARAAGPPGARAEVATARRA